MILTGKLNRAYFSGLKMNWIPSAEPEKDVGGLKEAQQKLKNSHKRNMEAKAMIKTVCKNMLYWADQMVLPWLDKTKPPIGVRWFKSARSPDETVAFMPIKRRGNGSGSTKTPSDFVALGRSRGVTGSDLTMSPSDLVAFTYQEAWYWFGHDQTPKWYNMMLLKSELKG